MRDAIGGALIIEIIIVFLMLVNSYLAFSVNYTKAFRIKNRIISIIENHEGFVDGPTGTNADIENMMVENNYSIDRGYIDRCSRLSPQGEYKAVYNKAGGYCLWSRPTSRTGSNYYSEEYKGSVYSVVTFVNIDIPVLNRIFPLFSSVFALKGETKTIYSSGFDTERKDNNGNIIIENTKG